MATISRTLTSSGQLYSLYLTVLSVLFALSLIVEKGKDVLWINGNYNSFLDTFFSIITGLGDGIIFLPITVIFLFVRFQYVLMSMLIMILSGVISIVFKQVLFPGMDRPKKFLDHDLLHFVQGVDVHSTHSFPSGHTMTAFCVALFLSLIFRNRVLTIGSLILALLVGYSRIYLLQHFLIDIAAGAVIGSFSTYMIWKIFESDQKPDWFNKRINMTLKSRRRGQFRTNTSN